jgi:protein SCO1/2
VAGARSIVEKSWLGAALGALLAAGAGPCLAHGTAAEHAREAAAAPGTGERASVTVRDIPVLDQNGAARSFAEDVVGDRLIALTLFYGTCTTTCPVTNAIFAMVQRELGDRMEREVRLVSVTVDPSRDRPNRLKALAGKHGAGPGWIWVTGEKTAMDRVLDGLNAFTPDYTQHPIMVLVGDPRSGTWSRLFGFPRPDAILERLDALAATRAGASLQTSMKEN